jgi:hypothetical protein
MDGSTGNLRLVLFGTVIDIEEFEGAEDGFLSTVGTAT